MKTTENFLERLKIVLTDVCEIGRRRFYVLWASIPHQASRSEFEVALLRHCFQLEEKFFFEIC